MTDPAGISKASKNRPKLSVRSDFDNGNAIVRYIDQLGRTIIVEPKQINEATNIWWHFIIEGIETGETLTIDTNHSPIAGDCQPVFSYDGEVWFRFDDQKPPFVQRFDQSRVEIARNIPYPYQRSLTLAASLSDCPFARVSSLCISEHGLDVPLLRITDPTFLDRNKKVVWVQARSHAFESHSSWVAEGFVQWLCGPSEAAEKLRTDCITFVVPILDVDNVLAGGAGKSQWSPDQQPVDLNREWGENSYWLVTREVMQRLQSLRKNHSFLGFIDLHDPWYYQGPEFYINKIDKELGLAFFELFHQELSQLGTPNSWDSCEFVTDDPAQVYSLGTGFFGGHDHPLPIYRYMLDEPSRHISSTGWVVQAGIIDPKSELSIVMEIPHWKDDRGQLITLPGLQGYGAALGLSLVKLLEISTRSEG